MEEIKNRATINFNVCYGGIPEEISEMLEYAEYTEAEIDKYDYVAHCERIAEGLVNHIDANIPPFNLKFLKLERPKYYNHESDAIIVEYESIKAIKQAIIEQELETELKEYIKERTTATSGYTPYYNQGEVYNNNNLLATCMLQVILDNTDLECELPAIISNTLK